VTTPFPTLLPGGTLGIVGGGQLGRMTAMAARTLGYRVEVLDPDPRAPAAPVADHHHVAALDDREAALAFARRCDVITLEWENADADLLDELKAVTPVHPDPAVLRVAQHRLREKERARDLGLRTAPFARVRSDAELSRALERIGTPALLKTSTGGYDGRGQAPIRSASEAPEAFTALEGGERELILEGWVEFEAELSVVVARAGSGEMRSYPPVQNTHRDGILDSTLSPAPVPGEIAAEAVRISEALAEALEVVGVLAVELFLDPEGRLFVNEIAPRPHNSGHWTLEGCAVSQFEQLVRAVCGLPLGSTEPLSPTAMVNLLGEHLENADAAAYRRALADPAAVLHLYGKAVGRRGRKMGHLTVTHPDAGEAMRRALVCRTSLAG
jgi:5-(carboxyamino)imidazole ribonucleotide synthase